MTLLFSRIDFKALARSVLDLGVSERMEFLEHLREIQHLEALTDKEMADRIGCSRQLYNMTRTGKVSVGYKILEGAVRAFPELEKPALYLLISEAHHLKQPGRPSGASRMRWVEQRGEWDEQKRACAKRILS